MLPGGRMVASFEGVEFVRWQDSDYTLITGMAIK